MEPLQVDMLNMEQPTAEKGQRIINNPVPPNDKACLIYEVPAGLVFGEFIDVALLADSGSQKWKIYRKVRANNKFLLSGVGGNISQVEWDSEQLFTHIMDCPAHAHGTHEDAAEKFLRKRDEVFSERPAHLTTMHICHNDRPRAWYKFGPLADAPSMNPMLRSGHFHDPGQQYSDYFHTFYWHACMAKKAAEPGGYIACVPLSLSDSLFKQGQLTLEEIRFMTFCAIASGARGLRFRHDVPTEKIIGNPEIEKPMR